MIYVGDKPLLKAYIGDTPVKRIFRGSQLIWPIGGDDTPPSAPTGVTVMDIHSDGFTIYWNDNPESDISHYLVYVNGEVPNIESPITAVNVNYPELSPNLSVAVAAVDTSGNISDYTYIDVYLQLDTPVIFVQTISGKSVPLGVEFVNGAFGSVYERATLSDFSDAVQIYAGDEMYFTDTAPAFNTTYYYRAKVTSPNNPDSDWDSLQITTGTA